MKINNIWITSDTHYGHKNIVRGISKWKNKEKNTRSFNTLEEHNDNIVNNINKYVNENDILYHLGDFNFGGKDMILEFRRRIKCKNIHLIFGNHDEHIIKNDEIAIPEEYVKWFYKISGYYPDYTKKFEGNYHINSRELFSSTQNYKEININKNKIILFHYSCRVWNGSHKGSYHLYGHSHSGLEEYPIGRSMDVGIDNAYRLLGEYRPFTINEIFNLLNNRSYGTHH